MTTGRINQVTARAQSPLQLGKAHESRPNRSLNRFFDRRPDIRRLGLPMLDPLRFIQSSSRTLHVPTWHVHTTGGEHAPLIRPT